MDELRKKGPAFLENTVDRRRERVRKNKKHDKNRKINNDNAEQKKNRKRNRSCFLLRFF